jgi:ubiquinone/menaquinone biosynthesis C-methylase UbiE
MQAAGRHAHRQAQPGGACAEAPRYDRIHDAYARYWAPVIAPWAEALLDHLERAAPELVAGRPAGRAVHVADIGTGTGTLAVAILKRWTGVQVTAVDPSAEMLGRALRAAGDPGPAATPRISGVTAFADRLPFADRSLDGAVASFVLQLVPNRARALREIARVLRSGGVFGHATWLRTDRTFAADRVADQVYRGLRMEPRETDQRAGDEASVDAAVRELRRAGFQSVGAGADELVHAWTPVTYVAFVEAFDEADRFDALPDDRRAVVRDRLLVALADLGPDDLTMRLPIVYVTGRRT